MLVVHWTPVNNTKKILKNGITKTRKGVFCFPLTGHRFLDRWWIYFFNQCFVRQKKEYNGIVFRIDESDFPIYFGHWVGSISKKDLILDVKDLKQLGQEYKESILFRIGEDIAYNTLRSDDFYKCNQSDVKDLYLKLGEEAIEQNPKLWIEKLNDIGFMTYTFEDYEIILSNSIPAKRIIKVIPLRNEFGRVLKKQKMNKIKKKEIE